MEEETIMVLDDGNVILRKNKFDRYRIVYPWKVGGKINWFNFLTGGSWARLITVIVVTTVLVGSVFLYKHDINSLVECCNNYYALKGGLYIP